MQINVSIDWSYYNRTSTSTIHVALLIDLKKSKYKIGSNKSKEKKIIALSKYFNGKISNFNFSK